MHCFVCVKGDYVHQLTAAILYGRLTRSFRLYEMLFDAWCRSRGDSATALPAAKLISDWPHAGMATRSQTSARHQSAHSSIVAAHNIAPADLPKATTDDRASASSSLLSSYRHYSRSTASGQELRRQQVLMSSAAASTSCRSSSSVRKHDQETSSTATSADANLTLDSASTAARHSAAAAMAAGHCAVVQIDRLDHSPSFTGTCHREVGRASSSSGGGGSGCGSRGSGSSSRFRADAFSLRLCNGGAAWDAVQVPLPLLPTLSSCRHASDALELAEATARQGVSSAAESSGSERRASAAAQLVAGTRAQAQLRRSLSIAGSSPPLTLQPVSIPRTPFPAPWFSCMICPYHAGAC